MKLEMWFEFASPYSYMAAYRIEAMLAKSPLELVWQPFLLGPIFQLKTGGATVFQPTTSAQARYHRRDVERLCTDYDIPLRWPSIFPRASVLASRVALLASQEGWGAEFVKAIYRANFVDDRDIRTEEVVSNVLQELGRAGEALIARASEPAIKGQLRQQVDRAVTLGIFGAPTFLLNGASSEIFWGNDRLEQAIRWALRPGGP